MRRVLVIASVLASLLVPLAAAPPAGAVSAGACLLNGGIAYQQPMLPIVPPQSLTTNVGMNLTLDCRGVGGGVWQMAGGGTTSGSCAEEVGNATLGNNGLSASAIWVRTGFTGYIFVLWASSSTPATTYGYEGPFVWLPANPVDCVANFVTHASITGAGPHLGLL